MMRNHCQVLELFGGHRVGVKEVPDVDDVGFQDLVQWAAWTPADDKVADHLPITHLFTALGMQCGTNP